MTDPLVTVLIPARDEAASIDRCLDHVLAQTWPADRLEVLVVDGGSGDGTGERAAARLEGAGLHRWAVLDNPVGRTPSNLNRGLAEATGDVLCRVDARSLVPPDYVACCVEVLADRPDVVVTGGAQVAEARDDGPVAVGIARALNNRWGMGGSRYRSGAASGPAETVYLGAFRTAQLRAAGGWDERYHTNQDFELNRRLGRQGVVWVDARLAVGYLPRPDLAGLWRQYRRFGSWKVRYWRDSGDPPQGRQRLLLAAPPVAGVLGAAWVLRRHPLRRAVVAGALGGAGLLAVDAAGTSGPPGGPAARAVAAAATVVVGLGWWTGVVGTALGGGSRAALPAPDAPVGGGIR